MILCRSLTGVKRHSEDYFRHSAKDFIIRSCLAFNRSSMALGGVVGYPIAPWLGVVRTVVATLAVRVPTYLVDVHGQAPRVRVFGQCTAYGFPYRGTVYNMLRPLQAVRGPCPSGGPPYQTYPVSECP